MTVYVCASQISWHMFTRCETNNFDSHRQASFKGYKTRKDFATKQADGKAEAKAEETPAAAAPAAEEQAPADAAAPAAEEAPAATDAPVAEGAPAAEQAPAAEEAPAVEQAPCHGA